ncbi:MAG: 30S ribosomal protein S12 methylthiotransferase RimO [Clostridiaceae bacterium]|nr:30S ribosomal protein S12 methylthiotransferase RimO [Clostridiaceae bacterium]
MKKKIGIVSLGCPKNLVDSEIMLGILKKKDFEITADESDANIIIVNTCGFIETAIEESINSILEMSKYKKLKCRLLIVTGCLAERYKEEMLKEIPEVDAVIGTGGYGHIAEVIDKLYKTEEAIPFDKRLFLEYEDGVEYLKGERVISTNKGYAYLKIAEGCDNCCTYCVIPSLRGAYTSRQMEDVIKEAMQLANQGVKEIILVAQDVTRYGEDIYKEKKLVELIREVGKIKEIKWIRLLYCYPEEIDENLIAEMSSNPKVVKYLDIPIQHASDKILSSMGRRGTLESLDSLLSKLKNRMPDIVIRTTLIVGFPGEDDKDFRILYGFVKKHQFDRLGVFSYSKEEGTPAYDMKPQIKRSVKESRLNDIMQLQKEIVKEKNNSRLNRTYTVLVEGVAEDGIFYIGRSYAEAPDIDGLIYFTSEEPLEFGSFVEVKILNVDDYDLIGEVINESSK